MLETLNFNTIQFAFSKHNNLLCFLIFFLVTFNNFFITSVVEENIKVTC